MNRTPEQKAWLERLREGVRRCKAYDAIYGVHIPLEPERFTKAKLIEAIKDMPDDAPIGVIDGWGGWCDLDSLSLASGSIPSVELRFSDLSLSYPEDDV